MHKVAKMVTQNNGVRRRTGLTRGFWFWCQGDQALRPMCWCLFVWLIQLWFYILNTKQVISDTFPASLLASSEDMKLSTSDTDSILSNFVAGLLSLW